MRRAISLPIPQKGTIPNVLDRQIWSFYDFQTYAAAGQNVLTYFQQPKGQSGRTAEDTNFPGAGSLPAGMQFTIQELQFAFFPGAAVLPGSFGAAAAPRFANDVYAVGSRGYVELGYSSKNYVEEGPLCRFPPDTRLAGFGAAADASTAAANLQTLLNYGQWAGKPFRIADLLLEPQINFNVTVQWPNGALALPSAVAGRLGCVLRGVLDRRPQ
jgi:hypothetical protein